MGGTDARGAVDRGNALNAGCAGGSRGIGSVWARRGAVQSATEGATGGRWLAVEIHPQVRRVLLFPSPAYHFPAEYAPGPCLFTPIATL